MKKYIFYSNQKGYDILVSLLDKFEFEKRLKQV
jgi:hypothetical protein